MSTAGAELESLVITDVLRFLKFIDIKILNTRI
jgi:hypothetical protein